MAGVLEMIRWPQKRCPLPPRVDPKILELQAAKEILAEVFEVRVSDVEEMIMSRYDDVLYEDSSGDGELWPMEFQLEEGQDSQSPA